MSEDKMRAEFEMWAEKQYMSLTRVIWKNGTVSEYAFTQTCDAWKVWQAAYAAGRLSVQQEKEAWSKAVNEAFINSARKSVADCREAQKN